MPVNILVITVLAVGKHCRNLNLISKACQIHCWAKILAFSVHFYLIHKILLRLSCVCTRCMRVQVQGGAETLNERSQGQYKRELIEHTSCLQTPFLPLPPSTGSRDHFANSASPCCHTALCTIKAPGVCVSHKAMELHCKKQRRYFIEGLPHTPSVIRGKGCHTAPLHKPFWVFRRVLGYKLRQVSLLVNPMQQQITLRAQRTLVGIPYFGLTDIMNRGLPRMTEGTYSKTSIW